MEIRSSFSRSLFFAKVFYFLFYAAWAALLPYLPLYYKSLGFSGSQIGLLTSISPLMTLLGGLFWSGLADATRQHKQILSGACLATMISVLALSQALSLGLLLLFVLAYAFFNSPIMPLLDNSVLTLLGEQRGNYGKQRLWGAVGWGLAGPVVGWMTGQYGLMWSFIIYLLLMGFALIVTQGIPIHIGELSLPFWKGVRILFSDRRWFLFLGVIFLSGMGTSMVSNFLFLYMEQTVNASRAVMGLALTMATVSEVPILFYSGWMLKKWGARGVLTISLAAYFVRAFGYSIANTSWQVLLLQLLHGLTFSAMWTAGVSYVRELAPDGLGATAQGVFSSMAMGLSGICGALVGGMLFDHFGGAGMYQLSGLAVLAGLLLFLTLGRGIETRTTQQQIAER